jgi:hypothetical protein
VKGEDWFNWILLGSEICKPIIKDPPSLVPIPLIACNVLLPSVPLRRELILGPAPSS